MAGALDPKNVQGDIVHGLAKLAETFIFIQIGDDIDRFRQHLAKLVPHITTAQQAKEARRNNAEHKKTEHGLRTCVGVNIAFSTWGTQKLHLSGINDDLFNAGMLADATALGEQVDPETKYGPNWIPQFKQHIDAILLIAGDSPATVTKKIEDVLQIFHIDHKDATIKVVHRIEGNVRPLNQAAHEHFGFADGISQPGIRDMGMTMLPGQDELDQGIFFLGRKGDVDLVKDVKIKRPDWALDGSFLVFRQLPQLVPEFDRFLEEKALKEDDLVPGVSGADLLGARMVGRWKSGAPLDITDKVDNPELGKDAQRNNVFEHHEDTQLRCPFAAHTRKMYPRDGSKIGEPDPRNLEQHRIIRRGIPYGDEVTHAERASGRTTQDRGLIFVCYQSNIGQGFHFLQTAWANNVNFPFNKPVRPGFDPIIGQTSGDEVRQMSGADPMNEGVLLPLNTAEFVGSNGGEYFFSPSIESLKKHFAQRGVAHEEI